MGRRTNLQGEQSSVLVVAESASIRRALAETVEGAGHAVVHADGAREALALALAWQPRVVCVDLRLPGMGADEVAFRMVAAFGSKRPLLVAVASPGATADDSTPRVGFDLVVDASALTALSEALTSAAPAVGQESPPTDSKRRANAT